jgi:hypothetical protein
VSVAAQDAANDHSGVLECPLTEFSESKVVRVMGEASGDGLDPRHLDS